MTTLPPNEPLDADELELARVLRALPGGEPPAALDAAILRAATNAAAASKRPVRRALASAGALWGIGSAAAAVLALGVAWQLRYGVNDESALRERAPRAHEMADSAEDASVQVDIPEQANNAPAAPAAAPMPMPADKVAVAPASARSRRQPSPAAGAGPAAAAPSAALAEPVAADQLASAAAAASMEKARDEERAKATAAESARAEAGMELKGFASDAAKPSESVAANAAPPPPPPAAYRPAAVGGGFEAGQSPPRAQAPAPARDERQALDQASSAGVLAQKTQAAPRKPETWLADIRKLRDAGKTSEARAALLEFRKKYPKWVIPTDLAPLLSE